MRGQKVRWREKRDAGMRDGSKDVKDDSMRRPGEWEWDGTEKRMILKGAAVAYQQAFDELMK